MAANGPLDAMPACWNDDERMNSLFAPFRKREMNPVDWASKMQFWVSVIEKWCFERNRAVVSVHLIQNEFRRDDRTPACITSAFQELCRTHDLRSRSQFLSLDPCEMWRCWVLDSLLPFPVSWSLNKYKYYWYSDSGPVKPHDQFVHTPFIQARASYLYLEADISDQKLLSFKDISDILSAGNQLRMCEDSVACVVQYLAIQGLAVVEPVANTKLVRLLKGDSDKPENTKFRHPDLAIVRLEKNKVVLARNIELLHLEKDKCLAEAKAFLGRGLDSSAKSCLRKKKQLEKRIEERTVALDSIESLLDSLHNTACHSKVMEAYKEALTEVEQPFESSGLSEDGVFEVRSQLQEMNEMQDEIQQAMSQSLSGPADEDIEKELDSMLSQVKSKETKLPDVPTYSLDSLLPDTRQVNTQEKLKKEPQALS